MFSIKFTFNNVMRRVQFDGQLNFTELTNLANSLFSEIAGKEIDFIYKDEEDDLITVSTDDELRAALHIQFLFNTELVKFTIQLKNNAPVSPSKAVHYNITCDECSMSPIVGIRFKCTNRHDYDLCENCEAKRVQPFPMTKIISPQASCQDGYRWRVGDFGGRGRGRGKCPRGRPFREMMRNCESAGTAPQKKGKETSEMDTIEKQIIEAIMKETLVPPSSTSSSSENTTESATAPSPSTEPTAPTADNISPWVDLAKIVLDAATRNTPPVPQTTTRDAPSAIPVAAESSPTAAPASTSVNQWERELGLLAEMGFTDENSIVPLLQRIVGDPAQRPAAGDNGAALQRVVWQLLSQYGGK